MSFDMIIIFGKWKSKGGGANLSVPRGVDLVLKHEIRVKGIAWVI